MKLVRFGPVGRERPGLLDGTGTLRDASGATADYGPSFFADGGLERLRQLDPATLPEVEGVPRIGPCIARPHKFLAVGLNYTDHAEEAGMPIPEEPLIFQKATSSIAGPEDDIVLPKDARKLDWEVEIALVIGRGGIEIPEKEAMEHIAGFCIVNDVSDRAWQLDGPGQWTKGKSHDGFGPVGPWLVTPDDVDDPADLSLWLEVDGVRRQTGSTSRMIFSYAEVIAHLSRHMRLEPGDLVTTGTPPGVGLGHKPPVFLRAGQEMTLGIDGLGQQRQRLVDAAHAEVAA